MHICVYIAHTSVSYVQRGCQCNFTPASLAGPMSCCGSTSSPFNRIQTYSAEMSAKGLTSACTKIGQLRCGLATNLLRFCAQQLLTIHLRQQHTVHTASADRGQAAYQVVIASGHCLLGHQHDGFAIRYMLGGLAQRISRFRCLTSETGCFELSEVTCSACKSRTSFDAKLRMWQERNISVHLSLSR